MPRKVMWWLLALSLLLVGCGDAREDFGRFEGDVQARWLDDGRRMELLAPLAYVGPDGVRWEAPAGLVVDGATIPRFFWRWIGGPYEGKYRKASVVHDHYCNLKAASGRRWQDVHRMFYHACRAGGLDEVSAKKVYWAVLIGGPRWPAPGTTLGLMAAIPQGVEQPCPYAGDVALEMEWIEQDNPPLDVMERAAR